MLGVSPSLITLVGIANAVTAIRPRRRLHPIRYRSSRRSTPSSPLTETATRLSATKSRISGINRPADVPGSSEERIETAPHPKYKRNPLKHPRLRMPDFQAAPIVRMQDANRKG